MSALIDISGQRFGALVVLRRSADRGAKKRPTWTCLCDCGREYDVVGAHLRSGATTRCLHCAQSAAAKARIAKHGPTRARLTHGHGSGRAGTRTTTYVIWTNMIQRTSNPNSPAFADYGGRGITVCDRWRDFANFLADMGERPSGLTLDRIDNDGGYEPNNCRWTTWDVQRGNQRPRKARVT